MSKINRLIYIDNLRAFAIVAVILLHVSGPYLLLNNNADSINWQFVNLLHSISRVCIPIFLMISGALLLNRDYSWKTFYTTNLIRLIKPFLFWTAFYLVFFIFYKIIDGTLYTINGVFYYCIGALLYGSAYHLWYMYLIIAIYLFIPFIANLDKKVSEKYVLCLLLLWGSILTIAQFVPEFKMISILRLTLGYFGYLILGYYFSKKKVNIYTSIIILFVGILFTMLPAYLSKLNQGVVDYSWYYYLNINVVLSSLGLFLVIKNIRYTNSIITAIAKYSFGIYFIHLFFIMLLNKILPSIILPQSIYIVLFVSVCFIFSLYAIKLLKQIQILSAYIY